jgi:large conductance mechanosensitive channel
MWQDFKAFLIKQNALALAIAVVIGGALDRVVKSIVDALIMPIVTVLSPSPERWESLTIPGPIPLRYGIVISALINFFIVGLVAWRISKAFIKPAAEPEKESTKACPFCRMADLDLAASRCPHCTSDLRAA